MKKVLAIGLGLAFIGISAFAETDAKALRKINDIRLGKNNKNQIEHLRVRQTATIGSNVTVTGNITLTGNQTSTGTMEQNGDIVMANDETLDNATDAQVRVTWDDNSTNWTYLLQSDNTATLNRDGYEFRIDASAYPTNSSGFATFARDIFDFTDVTSNSVDGTRSFQVAVAGTLTEKLSLSASGASMPDATVTNDLTIGDKIDIGGAAVFTIAAQVVTNGQAVTLSKAVNRLQASGEISGGTCVVTLANAPVGDQLFYLINTSIATNKLRINKAGTWKSAAVELLADEAVLTFSISDDAYYGIE